MHALQNARAKSEFDAWYNNDGKGWFKRELLAPRHRCDLDPFALIAERKSRILKRIEE
jgi:hypothetical protein